MILFSGSSNIQKTGHSPEKIQAAKLVVSKISDNSFYVLKNAFGPADLIIDKKQFDNLSKLAIIEPHGQ